MTSVLLDLPEEHAERLRWLEERIVGFDLGQLLAELSVAERKRDALTLDDVLGAGKSGVLRDGLTGLSPQQWQALWRRPWLLAELQDLVLYRGGSYWQKLIEPDGDESRPLEPQVAAPNHTETRRQNSWRLTTGLALGLLLGVGGLTVWNLGPGLPPEIANAAVRKELLRNIANSAERRWSAADADPRAALAEVQTLCRLLIANERRNPDTDLLDRCLKWSNDLAEIDTAFARDPRDATAFRAARETVGKLVSTLRKLSA